MSNSFPEGRDLQRQTLRLYGELLSRSSKTPNKFVFSAGPHFSATGLPAAVSINGGTSLIVDPEATTVKSVIRKGGVDFVVNTFDEALRVLKNEIRKHTPLSVVLVAEVDAVMREMMERGVVPDLQVHISQAAGDVSQLVSTPLLQLDVRGGIVEPSPTLSAWLAEKSWSEHVLDATSISELRTMDVRLMGMLDSNEISRLQWLRRITHYERPSAEAGRVVWLSEEERQAISTLSPG